MQAPLTRPSLLLALRDASDQEAWVDFVDLYTPLVFGYCLRRGLQEADAEDVAQEVMRSVVGGVQRLNYDAGRGRFRSWMMTVTRNKLNNFLVARGKRAMATADTGFQESIPDPATRDLASEWEREYQERLIEVALERVRAEFQTATWEAFRRTSLESEPVAKVADALGMSTGAVYIARSRVLARLRVVVAGLDRDSEASPQVE